MEYKEAPTQEDLKISFKQGFKAWLNTKNLGGNTTFDTQTDTWVNKINKDYL
jgi:hypothetical protein